MQCFQDSFTVIFTHQKSGFKIQWVKMPQVEEICLNMFTDGCSLTWLAYENERKQSQVELK